MQLYTNSIQDRYGNALKGAQITVRTAAGALATLYSDNGATLAPNPLTTSASGEFAFYAANGRYSFAVVAAGMQPKAVSAFEIYDPFELKAELQAIAAAAVAGSGIKPAPALRINGVIPVPAKIAAIYHEAYEFPFSFTLNDIDSQFNTAYLFHLRPAGTPAVANKRDNLGDGTFELANFGEVPISNDKIAALRARGVRVILTAGGSDNGFNFGVPGGTAAQARTRATNFLNSFKAEVTRLGGLIDGIDWNTFELYMRGVYANNPADTTANTVEIVWISQQLRNAYGPNFSISMPPNPDVFRVGAGSPYDLIVARALRDNLVLDYVAPQYYDFSGFKDLDVISNYHALWCNEFGASKVVMGLSHGNASGNFINCPTQAESDREVIRARAANPATRGWYLWSMHDKIAATAPGWITSMVDKLGATPPTPA